MTTFSIPQNKPLSAVDLEKKVEEYVRELAEETDAVRRSQWFKEYLDAVALFWRYSYRNQLLIFMQKNDAVRVAGFRTWNELGRRVKAGEKAIKILAPFTKKIVKKDEQTGEEKEESYTYFYPVSVFDVSQTEGKELPELNIDVEGNSHQQLLDKLLAFCLTQNIAVEFKQLGVNGLYGYSQGGKIVIGSNQSVNMQANTLIHEIAHELTHYSQEGKKFSKQEREIHAEATTYVVTKALGLENKSASYLALYTKDKNKIMESLETISKNARQILGPLKGFQQNS
ncbi:MAG: ArdC-like ssDNA-binding domain-containing protein [archaeon]|nr:ArdC-like ssDNA-binding domain-containing protein [archaeon]